VKGLPLGASVGLALSKPKRVGGPALSKPKARRRGDWWRRSEKLVGQGSCATPRMTGGDGDLVVSAPLGLYAAEPLAQRAIIKGEVFSGTRLNQSQPGP
jgi:hypothetical protein